MLVDTDPVFTQNTGHGVGGPYSRFDLLFTYGENVHRARLHHADRRGTMDPDAPAHSYWTFWSVEEKVTVSETIHDRHELVSAP